MIASENFTSKAVLDVVGSILTNKYAKDKLKDIMVVVKQLTKSKILQDLLAEIYLIQNILMFSLILVLKLICNLSYFLDLGDTVMGLNLSHGGHLTHSITLIFQENCIILFHIMLIEIQEELILMKY